MFFLFLMEAVGVEPTSPTQLTCSINADRHPTPPHMTVCNFLKYYTPSLKGGILLLLRGHGVKGWQTLFVEPLAKINLVLVSEFLQLCREFADRRSRTPEFFRTPCHKRHCCNLFVHFRNSFLIGNSYYVFIIPYSRWMSTKKY